MWTWNIVTDKSLRKELMFKETSVDDDSMVHELMVDGVIELELGYNGEDHKIHSFEHISLTVGRRWGDHTEISLQIDDVDRIATELLNFATEYRAALAVAEAKKAELESSTNKG